MSKRIKMLAVGAALAAALTATGAQADLFTFDPTGSGGGIAGVGTIDQAPGSALAMGGVTAINNYSGGSGSTGFTLYYQANLSSLQDGNGNIVFANGMGGHYFTFSAGFGETVVGAQPYPGTATFQFDAANPTNFFTMYATNALGNNLTGVGFNTGTAILTGHVASVASSQFQVTNINPTNLDNSPNGDQWNQQKTVTGSGSSALTLVIDSINNLYFPTLSIGNNVVMSFFNTSQVTPFAQVDPSKCFSIGSLCNGGGGGYDTTTSIGSLNGVSGPDFLFQADANQSIRVPEPGTVALMGLGLLAVGLGRIRSRRS